MRGDQPKLTVVIPARDAADVIGGQLSALAGQRWDHPWEVVVVDNGSTDGTREAAEGYAGRLPELRVVEASERAGQAYALNRGADAAAAPALAFCDADDEVGPGWVAAMGEALAAHELVACRSDVTKLNEPWAVEARGTTGDELGRMPFPPYAPFAGSGGLGVRREVHARLGGFDESMRAMFDVDYCLRAHDLGIELVLVPDAVLYYRYRSDLRSIFSQGRIYAEQRALVQRRHERPDERPRSWKPWVLRGWKPILGSLLAVQRRSGRAKLAWLLGWQLGRYEGSIRYRVRAL